jgi:hypothetical protein
VVAEWIAALSAVVASVVAIVFGILSLRLQRRLTQELLEQNWSIIGSQAAIEWRQQLFDLHDRGMNIQQIRDVMSLEEGWEAYERTVGKIDDILRNVPRKSQGTSGPPR